MQDLSETKTKERALDFVLGHLRDVTGLNAASLTARTAFAEIGLESLAVINFHMRIEPFFPGLSKAFLFDCRSADDVCAYLFQHWPDAARALAESLQSRAALTSSQQSDEAQEEWPDIALLRPTSDTKLRETGRSSEGAFAIVGMHCRFPGAESPAAFWENLLSGRDSIGEIPKGRWSINDFFEPEPGEARKKGRSYSKWGGFLDDVDRFDAPFFGISPREAAMMDPQERLFMECAWHALEDAALLGERSAPLDRDGGLDVGVFLGVTTNTYSLLGPSLWRAGMTEIPTAMPWSGANRLSYALNLRGPSMAVDTACSSALIALNLACESLARGECRAAVAGGVNLYLHPAKYVQLCQQHMLSPTGRCHAFGQDADGFAPGEGVGAVVLKRLADAHHDNDRILAVVLGSAVNHGGHTNGYTVPSPGAQSRVIKQALTRAGVDGTTIGYIEAHGTGTKLGDPIEIDGLKQAFGAEPSAPDCAVGSVKSNIGHLEAAAGVASLIKVVQQLRHRRIAPSLHAQHLNPALGLDGSRFFIAREAADWRPCGLTDRLRAGLSSFGAGGANAHVIVEDAPQPRACGEASGPLVFPLSARSAEQLRDAAAQLRDFIAADEPAAFARLAFTLQCGRRHFDHRFAVAAANHRELVAHLTAFLTGAAAADTRERDDTSSQALASRWAAGENVNWLSRWTNPPRPLDAPLYPFARDRHWVSPLDVESAQDRFSIAFTGDELFLRDHRINGEPVLPAAAYLGFCLEMARRSGLEGAFELRNLTWAAPFRPRDGVKSIICAATREPDGLSLDMSSRPATGDGQIVVHFKGRCAVPATASPEAPAESLSSLRARFMEKADAKGCYARFDALGLEYGPSFRCMEAAWLGENEALIELRRRAEDQPTALDPAMLDGVLQSAFLCSRAVRQHDDVAFVPYGAQSIRVHGTLGEHAYVHARRRQGQASDSQAFDFTVFATTGEVLLEIVDFAFRRFTTTPRAAAEADALHLLAPAWIAAPLQDKAVATGNLLIFDRDAALYESLRALSAGEGPPTDPWLALDSDKFLVRDGRIIEWNPRSPDHFDLLWRVLASENATTERVVINRSMPGAADEGWESAVGLREATEATHILRHLCQRDSTRRLHAQIVFAAEGAANEPPLATAISGLLRSLHLEIPTFAATVTLFDAAELADAPAIARRVLAESLAGSPTNVVEVRYGAQGRSVRRNIFIDTRAEAGPAAPVFGASECFVITGGLGSLGRVFAQALAGTPGIKIALVGRSQTNDEAQQFIASLERRGAHADYWQADCTARHQTDALLKSVRERFGAITGLIHCAGLLRDAFFTRQKPEDWEAVVRSKVNSAHHLDELTTDDPLRWFVVCSSLAGIHGNVGQSAYSLANAWLDRFAERRNMAAQKGRRRGDTISIAWPLWQTQNGMQAPASVVDWLARNGLSLLTSGEGQTVLLGALARPRPVLIPVKGQRGAIARLLAVATPGTSPLASTPATDAPPTASNDARESAVLVRLRAALSQVTRTTLEKISADASLELFGLDSILVMELNGLLESDFPRLSKTALFEARSLRTLARLIINEHPGEADRLVPALVEPAPAVPVQTAKTPEAQAQARADGGRKGDIAVIGLAGRYPGAETLDAFWDHLAAGHDLVTEIPGRWPDTHQDSMSGLYARWGGFLDDVDKFDPLFFGISPRDAERMDPQERLFLQTAWHAVENAGYTPETLSGPRDGPSPRRRVAVIAGVMYGEYQFFGAADGLARPRVLTNSSYASIANRVSYCLDLDGPSFAIDSMCSSSLTSLHLACELLRAGGCQMALAGGVNLSIHPYKYRMLCDLKFASTDGKCRSFGDGGDGYVPGEGVGVALLKPLDDAIRDGDHIYGVIRGSDIGHGGRTSGYTVPNADAQADVIRAAFARAEVAPARLGYVEAHGTGTSLGDPIEIRGLTKALGDDMPKGQSCAIGSLKANIGHLESAAGIAAVTKVLLQLKHRQIAPSIHCDSLNPNIDFGETPFAVQRNLAEWTSPNGLPRLASVSSWGAGGSNAHLVIEEYRGPARRAPEPTEPRLFVFSSRGDDQLRAMLRRFVGWLDREITPNGLLGHEGFSPLDVAMTLLHGRRAFETRLAVIAETFAELRESLSPHLENTSGANDESTRSRLFSGIAEDASIGVFQTASLSLDEQARAFVGGLVAAAPTHPWRKVPMPGYEFLRRRCWVDDEQAIAPPPTASVAAPAGSKRLTPGDVVKLVARGEIADAEGRSLLLAMV